MLRYARMRAGLLEHRRNMGEALWVYLALHHLADITTGEVHAKRLTLRKHLGEMDRKTFDKHLRRLLCPPNNQPYLAKLPGHDARDGMLHVQILRYEPPENTAEYDEILDRWYCGKPVDNSRSTDTVGNDIPPYYPYKGPQSGPPHMTSDDSASKHEEYPLTPYDIGSIKRGGPCICTVPNWADTLDRMLLREAGRYRIAYVRKWRPRILRLALVLHSPPIAWTAYRIHSHITTALESALASIPPDTDSPTLYSCSLLTKAIEQKIQEELETGHHAIDSQRPPQTRVSNTQVYSPDRSQEA